MLKNQTRSITVAFLPLMAKFKLFYPFINGKNVIGHLPEKSNIYGLSIRFSHLFRWLTSSNKKTSPSPKFDPKRRKTPRVTSFKDRSRGFSGGC